MNIQDKFDIAPDNSTIGTAVTPPASYIGSQDDPDYSSTAEPGPGSTFIIRSASSSDVITLEEGSIRMARRSDNGSHEWVCVENNGWLGFRNPVSGRFLGRDQKWTICCKETWHREWEQFKAKKRSGGYVLVMTHRGKLQPTGIKMSKDVKRLAMIENWESEEMIWEFIKI